MNRGSKRECLARKHFDKNDPNVAMGSSPDQSLLAALAVTRAQPAPIAKFIFAKYPNWEFADKQALNSTVRPTVHTYHNPHCA